MPPGPEKLNAGDQRYHEIILVQFLVHILASATRHFGILLVLGTLTGYPKPHSPVYATEHLWDRWFYKNNEFRWDVTLESK